MHSIHVHREEIGGSYEVSLDGKFLSASPSKALVGETVLEQLRRIGEAVLISVTDEGPANQEARRRSEAMRSGKEAAARVRAARGEQ